MGIEFFCEMLGRVLSIARRSGAAAPKIPQPFARSGVRQVATGHAFTEVHLGERPTQSKKVIAVDVPKCDEDFVTKDQRGMSNSHYIAYDAHKRIGQMARYWGVFPNVVPQFAANVNLVVRFGPSRLDTVYRGNRLYAEQLQQAPQVTFPVDKVPGVKHPTESPWALILVDAGADGSEPSEQKIHWLVANIPGNDMGDVTKGDTLVDYSPAYSEDGDHRFVFILAQQNGPLASVQAEGFLASNFIQENNLTPQGLAFYQAGEVPVPEAVNMNKIPRKYASKYSTSL